MEDNPKPTGAVYVLSNKAMEGYIKIGRTDEGTVESVVQHMRRLNNASSLPYPFKCERASAVEDATAVEKALHEAFGDYRVRPRREFFKDLALSRVSAILKLVEIEDVTPASGDTPVVEAKQPKKPPFRFDAVGIPIGATLQWKDDPDIECQVNSDTTYVLYEGRRWAISTLAKELKGWYWTPAGPDYWLYKGELLRQRERRFTQEQMTQDDG